MEEMTKEELEQYVKFCLGFRELPEDKKEEIYFMSEGAKFAAEHS